MSRGREFDYEAFVHELDERKDEQAPPEPRCECAELAVKVYNRPQDARNLFHWQCGFCGATGISNRCRHHPRRSAIECPECHRKHGDPIPMVDTLFDGWVPEAPIPTPPGVDPKDILRQPKKPK